MACWDNQVKGGEGREGDPGFVMSVINTSVYNAVKSIKCCLCNALLDSKGSGWQYVLCFCAQYGTIQCISIVNRLHTVCVVLLVFYSILYVRLNSTGPVQVLCRGPESTPP